MNWKEHNISPMNAKCVSSREVIPARSIMRSGLYEADRIR